MSFVYVLCWNSRKCGYFDCLGSSIENGDQPPLYSSRYVGAEGSNL